MAALENYYPSVWHSHMAAASRRLSFSTQGPFCRAIWLAVLRGSWLPSDPRECLL